MVEDTSINEVEVREDNLIGTHEERVNEALLVVDTLELPDECSLGSRMPGFIGQILLKHLSKLPSTKLRAAVIGTIRHFSDFRHPPPHDGSYYLVRSVGNFLTNF